MEKLKITLSFKDKESKIAEVACDTFAIVVSLATLTLEQNRDFESFKIEKLS